MTQATCNTTDPNPTDRALIDQLLIAALQRFFGVGDPTALARYLQRGSDDLGLLLERTDEEGLAGILLEVLPPAAYDQQPLLIRQLRQRRLQIFAHNARVLGALDRLGLELTRADLQVIAVKGASLLMGTYRQHLGCRPLSDIDLLVQQHQLEHLQSTLRRLGWRSHGTRWRGDGLEIDLHTDLGRCALLGQQHAAFRFANDALWRHSEPSSAGPSVRKLAPATQVAHLATHAVKHAFSRWIWLVDLIRLLPTVPIEALEVAATHTRAARPLAYCASLMRHLGLPDPAWAQNLPKLNTVESAWLRLIAKRHRIVGLGSRGPGGRTHTIHSGTIGLGNMIAGLSIPGLGKRLAYWREVALPPSRRLQLAAPLIHQNRQRWLASSLLPRTRQAFRLVTSTTLTVLSKRLRARSQNAAVTPSGKSGFRG